MGCITVGVMLLLGCIFPKKSNRAKKPRKSKKRKQRAASSETINSESSEEVTIVESIHLPLDPQPAMQEPRARESEQQVLNRLKDEGLLNSETLNETKQGKSFYLSLDGNPYPSGKPRLLEPIQFQYDVNTVKSELNFKMNRAAGNRKNELASVKRKAQLTSSKVEVAQVKEEQRRRDLKNRLDRKMEQAARNRLLSRGR